jgi:hypothetical protein
MLPIVGVHAKEGCSLNKDLSGYSGNNLIFWWHWFVHGKLSPG